MDKLTFSDSDLAQLKEYVQRDLKENPHDQYCQMVQGCLTRLEKAEAISRHHSGHDEDCDEVNGESKCSCGYARLEKAWMKASGK